MTLSFLEFSDAAGIEWTPAQREFAAVAFDKQQPSGDDVSKVLWGHIEKPIPLVAWKTIAAVCGRGSGKSYLAACRLAHLACTIRVSKLARGEVAVCPVVSTDIDTARQVVRFAMGICETLKIKIVDKVRGGDDGFTIVRKGGKRVQVLAKSASVGGKSIRGRSMPCAVLDEAAFFRDASHKINDVDIYDALRYRIMEGGQIILLSTPWIESGLLYDLWHRNFSNPVDALVAHAPTGLMRTDDEEVLASIEAERLVDPDKCSRERDANFMSANAASYFNAQSVTQSITELAPIPVNATVAVGGDFAFRRNSSAFVAVRAYVDEETEMPVYEVVGIMEKKPKGAPLKPSVVCRDAAVFARNVGSDQIVADGFSREAVMEHLINNNVLHVIAPQGTSGKQEVFNTARLLFHEGQVRISKSIEGGDLVDKLKRQLNEVTARPLQGGSVSIESPLWSSGEHGDLVSALVLALWRANKMGPAQPEHVNNPYGIDEHQRRLMEQAAEDDARHYRVARLRTRVSLLH